MSDLISRQALIEHLRRTIEASSNDGDYNEGFNDGMDFAACFASTLPSAQPERKKGRWYLERHVWFCDQCEKNPTKGMGYVQGTDELFNFCPNCGADMRG